jgi:hypothetical protein
MNLASILGGSGGLLTVAGIIYTAINHKRVRVNCCGKKMEVAVDVESTAKVAPEPTEPKKEDENV